MPARALRAPGSTDAPSLTSVTIGGPPDELEHHRLAEFRCAPWTHEQGVDPIGSTATFDALVLVEVPLPWPHDVSELPLLAGRSAPGVRVMAVVPEVVRPGNAVRVVHHRRLRTNHLAGVDHLAAPGQVADLLDALLAAPMDDSSHLPTADGEAPPEVLVCAHGRRDPCCGRFGTLLHNELGDLPRDVRVWRCSHTGGHRFAPTAITLPDGRAWAYADLPLLEAVISRSGPVSALVAADRGTSALDSWAQVAERAVFQQLGWAWFDQDLTEARTKVAPDGRTAEVHLAWEGGQADAVVEVLREIPVLVCGEPPERATKVSLELGLRSFTMG